MINLAGNNCWPEIMKTAEVPNFTVEKSCVRTISIVMCASCCYIESQPVPSNVCSVCYLGVC